MPPDFSPQEAFIFTEYVLFSTEKQLCFLSTADM